MIKVIRFTALWCAPCRMVAPALSQLEAEFPEVKFSVVDIEKNPEMALAESVRSIPTVLIYKDGMCIGRINGAQPKSAYKFLIEEAVNESKKVI